MWNQRTVTNDANEILLPLYAIFWLYHAFNRGKSYRHPHRALPWHIAAGSTEIILYYAGYQCSLLAVAACMVHSLTGMQLVNALPNGYPLHTRPTYQAGSIMRPVQMLWAYYTQEYMAYHDAIMPIHAFLYTRIFFFMLGTIGPTTSFTKNVNSRFVYTQAILGGALMAVGHCSRPTAVLEYLTLVHILGKLGYWTKRRWADCRENNRPLPIRAKLLLRMGIVTRGESLAEPITPNPNPKIVPEIGNLPVDVIGQYWARWN